MKHLGDITKIKGYEAPIVDCIIGGSPCQDLSLAGKRAGLAGARSGLYMEQIRIIKEMREHDRVNGRTGVDIRPRYMVWENVPGAFSTNQGQDFAAVLEEAIRVAEPEAPPISVPEKGWPTAGCIIDEMGKWSVCWRVMDAQFWGVPQRRRRICLVCDFNGLNAPKIVFGETEHHGSTERSGKYSPVGHPGGRSQSEVQPVTQGLSGNSDESQQERQATAGDAGDGLGGAIGCDLYNGALSGDKAVTLNTNTNATGAGPTVVVPEAFGCDTYNYTVTGDKACTLNSNSCITSSRVGPTVCQPVAYNGSNITSPINKTNPQPGDPCHTLTDDNRNYLVQSVIAVDQGGGKSGASHYEDISPTLTCTHGGEPAVVYSINHQGGNVEQIIEGKTGTLTAAMNSSGNNKLSVAYGIQGSMIGRVDHNGPQGDGVNEDVSFTLNTTDRHAVVYGISPYHSNCMKSDNPHSGYYEADTARSLDAMNCGYPGCNQGGMAVVETILDDQGGSRISVRVDGKSPTLRAEAHGNLPCVLESTGFEMQAFGKYKDSGIASALKARDYKDATDLVVAGVDCRNATEYPEINGTIQAKSGGGFSLNCNQVVRVNHIVRRLTPLECERLQGFPDGWTDIGEWVDSKGKKHKEADSPRYKALGNSIAIPPWKWVLKRLCACYERDATMASLFDGISGFPLIWTQLNGWGSVKWSSEIDEFPMAVCKKHFGDEETGLEGDFYEAILGRSSKADV